VAIHRHRCATLDATAQPMTSLPQKQSLVAQTYAILKEQIHAGVWEHWMPSEWELSEQLKVSRRTVRAALAQLEHGGLLKGGQGRQREITDQGKRFVPAASSDTVILLSSDQPTLQPSFSLFVMDDLRTHLNAANYRLEVHFHQDNRSHLPGAALTQLVRRTRPAGWVLASQTAPVQRWFSQRGLPCVILGSRHEGVSLPSVDIDFRALSRHATGLLLAKGCQRVALLIAQSGLAGDLESERGFKEAVKRFQHGGEAVIGHHDGTIRGVCERLRLLLQRRPARTGFIVSGANYLMMTLCFLQRQGIRVPEDVALVSQDDDVFMQHAIPSIARYAVSPRLVARKVSRVLLQLTRYGLNETRDYRLMPRFVPGESMG
jgi:DNA-binding LacI/PurR family transcriptional regulator